MLIALELNGTVQSCDMPEFDEEIDDYRSFLINACDAIEAKGLGRFCVAGFGQEHWPVDVTTDLPVFLEQLPQALVLLRAADSFEIDFYEQGIQRALFFSPCGEQSWKITCVSQTSWAPDPQAVVLDDSVLKPMLHEVYREFRKCVEPLEKSQGSWVKPARIWRIPAET